VNTTRRHASTDPSFARSASSAAGRGLFLIGLAVLIGIVLLRSAFDDDGGFIDTDDSTEQPGTTTDETTDEASDTTATVGTDTTVATPVTGTTHPPNEVKLLVLNGAGVVGAAGRATDTLSAAGFAPLEPADAPARVEATAVYATAGYEADAAAVAAALGAPPTSVAAVPDPPPADLQGANVLVVLGPDVATEA
jgi:hypothetical protein